MTAGWRVRGEIFLWRRGWLWPLAGTLAVAALALDHQVRESHAHSARLEASLQALPASRPRTMAPQDKEHALPADIMAAPDVTASVTRMLALAQAAGIELAQAEYQHTAHAVLQMRQTQVTQPLRASYPQLRRYLESVLRELPHASLDHVAARRDTVAQGQLEVRLQWSLWGPAPTATIAAGGKSP